MRRLTILLAALAALMLVPAASALASSFNLNAIGTGSGEVTSIEEFPYEPGEPPIECSYNGTSTSGVCENEPEELENGEPGIALLATAAPGSEFATWTIQKGNGGSESSPLCPYQGEEEYCLLTGFKAGEDLEATAIFCPEGEPDCAENIKLDIEEGSGTVVSNPAGLVCSGAAPKSCETSLAAGKYTLTASPAPGYLVKSWKGCDAGGVNGRQCTVTAGSSLKTVGVKFYKVWKLAATKAQNTREVHYEYETYEEVEEGKFKKVTKEGSVTLFEAPGAGILGTSPGGINCGYACGSSSALYKEGSLTVKAKPAKHFHFVEFKGGTGSASSCNGVKTETCTFSITEDSAIEELYTEDAKNTLVLKKTDMGEGHFGGGQGFIKTKPSNINCGLTCTAAEAQFYASETAEVTVTLGKGTTSVTWLEGGAGTCTGHALTCSVPMSVSHSLVAEFK
ncbi:MAG TPA: hypothetical protein VF245_08940 [Solirubrobacterales bacterium]